MTSRKGFEISISTLVVLILGIVIVTAGILLLKSIVSESDSFVSSPSKDAQNAINSILDDGQAVAVYPAHLELSPGKSGIAELGIENALVTQERFDIQTNITNSTGTVANNIAAIYMTPATIDSKQRIVNVIAIKTNKSIAVGTYTVIVTVRTAIDNQIYDSPRFFTVTIK